MKKTLKFFEKVNNQVQKRMSILQIKIKESNIIKHFQFIGIFYRSDSKVISKEF